MEVRARGGAGAGSQEQAGGAARALASCPFAPGLRPLVEPGGHAEAGGREGRLWKLPSACDIQTLRRQARLGSGDKRDVGTATRAWAGTCPCASLTFPDLNRPQLTPLFSFSPDRPLPDPDWPLQHQMVDFSLCLNKKIKIYIHIYTVHTGQ